MEWFVELSASRGSGFSGPEPLRPSDVHAWSVLRGVYITNSEYVLIQAMDAAFVNEARRHAEELTAKYKAEAEKNNKSSSTRRKKS